MNRREILKAGTALGALLVVPRLAHREQYTWLRVDENNFHTATMHHHLDRIEVVCNACKNFKLTLTDGATLAGPIGNPSVWRGVIDGIHTDWVARYE